MKQSDDRFTAMESQMTGLETLNCWPDASINQKQQQQQQKKRKAKIYLNTMTNRVTNLVLSIVHDNVSGVGNFIRCLNKELRLWLPASLCVTNIRDLYMTTDVFKWFHSASSVTVHQRNMLLNKLLKDGRYSQDDVVVILKHIDITREVLIDIIKYATIYIIKQTRQQICSAHNDELIATVAISNSRFDVLTGLNLELTPELYVHAVSSNNETSVGWLWKRGVKFPRQHLGVVAARHGHATMLRYLAARGIAGCKDYVFKTACIEGKIDVLEAMWDMYYFSHTAYCVAFKTGNIALYKWCAEKEDMDLSTEMFEDSLIAVINRDDIDMYKILAKYRAVLPQILNVVYTEKAEKIACYIHQTN